MYNRDVYIIIGNGFDLECGLKTRYCDFISFISAVNKNLYYQPGSVYEDALIEYKQIKKETYIPFDITKWEKMPKNFWYRYLVEAHIPDKWIDFENEIAKVITIIEEEAKKAYSIDDTIYERQVTPLFNNVVYRLITNEKSRMTFRQIRDYLLIELEQFTNAFNLYLQHFVENAYIIPTDAINRLFDNAEDAKCHVLTFNYTTTFERLIQKNRMKSDIDYCYIHGRVGQNDSLSRLVLGMNERKEYDDETDTLFAPFSKCFQRIEKNTDSHYEDWLRRMQNYEENHELYIFGHSLGITDKRILNRFILSPGMNTTIYSYNEEARKNQIANMMAIIGNEKLEDKREGTMKLLRFMLQDPKAAQLFPY